MPASSLGRLLARVGPEVVDPDEETFLLFAQERPPAQNLGFVDAHAAVLDLTVAGRDLTTRQSPAVLTSSRPGGTTGAVLWKITPAVAEWLARPDNLFFRGDDTDGTTGLLGPDSAVLELGCGIAGVIGLALTGKGTRSDEPGSSKTKKRSSRASAKRTGISSPESPAPSATVNTVARYVLTDQPYVARLLQRNLQENGATDGGAADIIASSGSASTDRGRKRSTGTMASLQASSTSVYFRPLDWETDEVTSALLHTDAERGGSSMSTPPAISSFAASFDAVLACDCIYNEALVAPLLQTCVDACRLRQKDVAESSERYIGRSDQRDACVQSSTPPYPTLCIVAQQLRDPDVLTAWLAAFHAAFRVWRVPEELLIPELWPTAGFVVHVGILRET